MIAVAGAGLLFGIKVVLHHKEKKDADDKQPRHGEAHGGAAERRASQWLSSQSSLTPRDSVATTVAHSMSQHALLDEGYLVCFTNSRNEVLCVTNVGSQHEVGWHTQSAPEGNLKLEHVPHAAVFMVSKVGQCLAFRSLGGSGRMLRASGNGSADHHTISSYQIGSYELWRFTPQGLFNVHFKNKALGWDVKELQLVTGGSVSDASGMHQRTVKLLQAKVRSFENKLSEAQQQLTDALRSSTHRTDAHKAEIAELLERISSLQRTQSVAEREVLSRSTNARLLDHRVAILAADKEGVERQLQQASGRIAALEREMRALREKHSTELQRLEEASAGEAAVLRRERELALARAAQTTQELAATRHEQRSEVERVRQELEGVLRQREAEVEQLSEQCTRLDYALKVIKQQICEATDPTVALDRASLDTFTVAGLREAVAQAVGPGGSSKKAQEPELFAMLRRNGSSGSDRPGSAGSDLARALSVHDHLPWAQEQGQGQAAAGGRAQQHPAEPAVTRTPNQLQRQAQQQLQSHHSSQPELQHTVATAASLVGASGNALPGEDGCEFDDGSSCLAESIEGGGEEDEGDEDTGGGHQDDGNADVVRRDDEEQADQQHSPGKGDRVKQQPGSSSMPAAVVLHHVQHTLLAPADLKSQQAVLPPLPFSRNHSLLGDKSASSKANSLQQAGSEARDSASSLPPRSDATGLQQAQQARPYSDDESRCNIGSAAGTERISCSLLPRSSSDSGAHMLRASGDSGQGPHRYSNHADSDSDGEEVQSRRKPDRAAAGEAAAGPAAASWPAAAGTRSPRLRLHSRLAADAVPSASEQVRAPRSEPVLPRAMRAYTLPEHSMSLRDAAASSGGGPSRRKTVGGRSKPAA